MKKIYSTPVVAVELFETADVITVSEVVFVPNDTNATNVPKVNLNEKFS